MKILGISCYYHDSSAALLIDGKVVSAAAEERFTRKKHDSSFPINSIKFCLSENNLAINDIDYIAFYEKPVLKFERLLKSIALGFPKTYLLFMSLIPSWIKEKVLVLRTIRKKLKYKKQVFFIEHHVSHAGSFFASPFKEAAILIVDGVGEFTTSSYGYGKENKINIKKEINFPDSIGLFYSAITAYLGFSVNNSEYKVMGLSAYGQMQKEKNEYYEPLKKVIDIKNDGSFKLDMSYFAYQNEQKMCSEKMFELLGGRPRKKDEEITVRHKDIASALQIITEEVLAKMLDNLYREFPCENLIFGGGVALNSVFNGKILKQTKFKNIWIIPDPGDGGTSIGCALYLYNCILNQPRVDLLENAYLGPEFSNEEIKNFLDENKIKYSEFIDENQTITETARLIFENKVVGWFQGKMEFGPRALGNRSILANPLNPKMQDILNLKVKHREQFRPFAPVVLKEAANKYFECGETFQIPCNFMLMVYPIKEEWRSKIPAVTHIDGTGRLQTIEEKQNQAYYRLIKEFENLSGIPILINTSFNVRGEPIVCAPRDAYLCMMGTEIDCLVMGKYLIKRSENLSDSWDSDKKSVICHKSFYMQNIKNKIKRTAGALAIVLGIAINQTIINNFFVKIPLVSGHKGVSSVLEVFLIAVGSLLLFGPELMTLENIGKVKKQIGAVFIIVAIILNPVVVSAFFIKGLKIQSLAFSALFFLEMFFIVFGGILFLRPEFPILQSLKNKRKEIILLIICLFLTDFTLSFIVPPTYKIQCERGWCNYKGKSSRIVQDTPYISRKVNITYYDNGFKRWGDPSSDKKKILILGDSFTQDIQVSNGEEWYSYLEKSYPNTEFFVYGSGGYSSLQEYMVLDSYIDKINPDVILWQFCGNDYSDNYYPFDRKIYGRNNLGYRPYLENGSIVYRQPVPFLFLREYSAVSDKLLALYDKDLHVRALADKNVAPRPPISNDIMAQSRKITEEIMQKVGVRANGKKIYMFNACGAILAEEKTLCQIANMNCIEGIREGAEKQGTDEEPVHPVGDGHWNLKGNKIVGEMLVDYFKKNNVLPFNYY